MSNFIGCRECGTSVHAASAPSGFEVVRYADDQKAGAFEVFFCSHACMDERFDRINREARRARQDAMPELIGT